MTLSAEDKKTLSQFRLKKAKEFLDDAERNYDDGRYRTSINRSYYAALNAARALLILEGANPETHDGIITMLRLRFVKKEILSAEMIKKFKLLLSRRTDVDYGDFDSIDKEDALSSLNDAKTFIQAIEQAMKKILL
ncbi:MAG: HEPN domain-containing protein [Spirochaetota bacterium]